MLNEKFSHILQVRVPVLASKLRFLLAVHGIHYHSSFRKWNRLLLHFDNLVGNPGSQVGMGHVEYG